MESIYVSPPDPAESSNRITISYPQLRSLGYLRPAAPADLPEEQGEFCTRQIVEGDTGWGVMETWPVFPGMDLIWFEMNTDCYLTLPDDPEHRLEILCCYEGRCEVQGGLRRYCYMEEGDLAVCSASPEVGLTGFPASRFQGICLAQPDGFLIFKHTCSSIPQIFFPAEWIGGGCSSECIPAH